MHIILYTMKLFSKIVFVVAILMLFNFAPKALATDVVYPMYGYAWSDNVGWISFSSCADPSTQTGCAGTAYNVSYDATTGVFTGYAWSDNIGWISFDRSITGTPPSSDPGNGSGPIAEVSGGNVIGWARATAPMSGIDTGGWDGWISLSGVSVGASSGGAISLSGYAWGDTVVGWVYMNGVKYHGSVPSLTLTPDHTTITSGDTVNFTVTATGFSPTKCTGSYSATPSVTDSVWTTIDRTFTGAYPNIHVPNDTTTTFILKCSDNGSNINVQATASVASSLNPSVSYNGACLSGGATPTLSWTSNALNSATPACYITATPSDTNYPAYYIPSNAISAGGRLSSGTSGTVTYNVTSGTITDNSYARNTNYKITCSNGTGSYKDTVTSAPPGYAGMCVATYTIGVPSVACNGSNANATLTQLGNQNSFTGSATLTLSPSGGFTNPVSITDPTGTLSFSPSSFTYGSGGYNAVTATLNTNSNTTQTFSNLSLTAPQTGPKTISLSFCQDPTAVTYNSCTNGATNYPSCTTNNGVCINGATNYPTCTFNACPNGAYNFPACTVCYNGATNPPTCGSGSSSSGGGGSTTPPKTKYIPF